MSERFGDSGTFSNAMELDVEGSYLGPEDKIGEIFAPVMSHIILDAFFNLSKLSWVCLVFISSKCLLFSLSPEADSLNKKVLALQRQVMKGRKND